MPKKAAPEKKEWPPVTEEQFRAYEEVRREGKTNMMAWSRVQDLALERVPPIFLSREDVLAILMEYTDIKGHYVVAARSAQITPTLARLIQEMETAGEGTEISSVMYGIMDRCREFADAAKEKHGR